MTDKFDLRKYLIENKVTTNSKLLKEIQIEPDWNVGRRDSVIEIKRGPHGKIESIQEHLLDTTFETYCYVKSVQILVDISEYYGAGWVDYAEEYFIGEPFFNADMTACDINADKELGYVYILSSSLQADVKAKLLDKETSDDEINDIISNLKPGDNH